VGPRIYRLNQKNGKEKRPAGDQSKSNAEAVQVKKYPIMLTIGYKNILSTNIFDHSQYLID
jgi:hypothetical protein